MSCEEYIVWISGHLDGTNEEAQEQLLQEHLASCPHCREVLKQMELNDAAIGSTLLEPPARITQTVMKKVRAEVRQKRRRLWSYALSGVAAAAFFCLILTGALRHPKGITSLEPTLAPAYEFDTPAKAQYDLRSEAIPTCGSGVEEGSRSSVPTESPLATEAPIATHAPVPTEALISEGSKTTPSEVIPLTPNCVFIYNAMDVVPLTPDSGNLLSIVSEMNEAAYSYHSTTTHTIVGTDYLSRTEIDEIEADDKVEFISEPENQEFMVIYCTMP